MRSFPVKEKKLELDCKTRCDFGGCVTLLYSGRKCKYMRNFTFHKLTDLLPQVVLFSVDRFYICGHIFTMAMQDVINKMKGTALGVAEYLTPVLKVRSHLPITSSYLVNWCSISRFLNFYFPQESKFQDTGVITPEEVCILLFVCIFLGIVEISV